MFEMCRLGIPFIFLFWAAATDIKSHMIKGVQIRLYELASAVFVAVNYILSKISGTGFVSYYVREHYTGIALGIILLLISRISRGKLGEGDGLEMLISGFWFTGAEAAAAFAVSLYMAGGCSVAGMLAGRLKRTSKLAFMPFVFAAFLWVAVTKKTGVTGFI